MKTLNKNLFKQPFFWTSVCCLLAIGILGGIYAYGWVAPTASPNSNAGAAINFSGDNVGIGTTSPGSKLEVNRTTALGVTLGTQGYIADFIGNAGSSVSNLFITQYRSSAITGHESSEFRLQRVIDATRMGYIAFTGSTGYTERSTVLGFNNTPQLTILGSSGKVGIGTTAPGEQLEVAGGNLKVGGSIKDSAGNLIYDDSTKKIPSARLPFEQGDITSDYASSSYTSGYYDVSNLTVANVTSGVTFGRGQVGTKAAGCTGVMRATGHVNTISSACNAYGGPMYYNSLCNVYGGCYGQGWMNCSTVQCSDECGAYTCSYIYCCN